MSVPKTQCVTWAYILGQSSCQLPLQPSVVLDQWTCAGGIVSTDVIVYLLKRLLVLPLVDDTFLHLAALINSNILSLQTRQQDSGRGIIVGDRSFLSVVPRLRLGTS